MSVIRCETCKGTGKIEVKVPLFPMQGTTVVELKRHESNMHMGFYNVTFETCKICGGSGCKWMDDKNSDDEIQTFREPWW